MTNHKFFDTKLEADSYVEQINEWTNFTATAYWCKVNQVWVVETFMGVL